MSIAPARIMIVDDEAASMQALCDTLRDQGYGAEGFTTGEAALRALSETQYDLLLSDLNMPAMDGVALLTAATRIDPHLVAVLMTGAGTIETAVQAMRAGALDYVLKPVKLGTLLPVLARALTVRRLRLENLELRDTVAIHELNQALAHTLDLDELLDKIADAVIAQFEADEASIMLLTEDKQFLEVTTMRGAGREKLLGTRMPVSEGVAGWVATRREPVVLEGKREDPRTAPLYHRADIRTSLSMPLVARGRLIGVININCTSRRGNFSGGKIKAFSIFTTAAAAGIEATRLQAQQRRLDARYREVLQMVGDGIVSVNEEQRIVLFNAGAEALFGYASDEVIGQPLELLLPAGQAEVHRRHVLAFEQSPQSSRALARRDRLFGRHKNGAQFNIEVNISRRRESGKMLYTAVVRDVTERVRQDEKVARLTRIQAVLGGINSAIARVGERGQLFQDACRIAVDEGGFGVAWIGVLDPVAQTITPVASAGVDAQQLLAAHAAMPLGEGGVLARAIADRRSAYSDDLAHESSRGGAVGQEALRLGYRSFMALPLLVGEAAIGGLVLHARSANYFDDEELDLLNRLASDLSFGLDHIAKTDQLMIAHRAIEQERELLVRRVAERTAELTATNSQLEKAKVEAEQANRAKSAFLASMSHEIRTPMNGVVGMLEVLAQSRLTEDQADAVRTIRASAFALLGLIDDVLDFSKIEADRLELERVPVALPELVEGVCETLLPVALDKGVELGLFISPQVPAQVRSDPTRLRQVLFNLVGNAIKFTAGQASRRGRVSLRVEPAGGVPQCLIVRVADNGIGISPEGVSRLFSPFMQAESSTTRRFGGTGLGLAICQRLVTLMGGQIGVQSTPDKGSLFSVSLPLESVDAVETAHGANARQVPDLGGLDCIILGPHRNADDLRVYLEHAGARVHAAANLEAAVRRAAGQARSVVIHRTRRGGLPPELQSDAFAALPDVRHVLIARGRRRGALTSLADMVILDGNLLRRSALLRAVAVAAGRASPELPHDNGVEEHERGEPPTIAEARAQGRLILIAEDDQVNQKVILRQLGLLGYAAEVAANGKEALQLWRAGSYALLMTDLHMPVMDGYALAETIRQEEAQRNPRWQARMPILALTANAMRSEVVRAKASGIDEYLTKPLQLRLLKTALKEWMPIDGGDSESATLSGELCVEPQRAQAAAELDVVVLEAVVGNDAQVVHEFLGDYRVAAQRAAIELRTASAADDLRQIGAIAHKLKSTSRAVGALALADLCAELENASRTGARAAVAHHLLQFDVALLAVESRIDELLARI